MSISLHNGLTEVIRNSRCQNDRWDLKGASKLMKEKRFLIS